MIKFISLGVLIAGIWLGIGFFAFVAGIGCGGLSGEQITNSCSLIFQIIITVLAAPYIVPSFIIQSQGTMLDFILIPLSALFMSFVLLYLISFVFEKYKSRK
jgi:hypothetical protein